VVSSSVVPHHDKSMKGGIHFFITFIRAKIILCVLEILAFETLKVYKYFYNQINRRVLNELK